MDGHASELPLLGVLQQLALDVNEWYAAQGGARFLAVQTSQRWNSTTMPSGCCRNSCRKRYYAHSQRVGGDMDSVPEAVRKRLEDMRAGVKDSVDKFFFEMFGTDAVTLDLLTKSMSGNTFGVQARLGIDVALVLQGATGVVARSSGSGTSTLQTRENCQAARTFRSQSLGKEGAPRGA